jgi:hypothetical protein
MPVGEGYRIPEPMPLTCDMPGPEYRDECSEPCGEFPRSDAFSDIGWPWA